MPELSEFFTQARELNPNVNFEDEQQRNTVFEALKKAWNPLYQALVNFGFGSAQARFEPQLTTEKEARKKAEDDLKALQDKVREKQDPDIKQLNEQWQTKLNEETGKLKTDLEKEKARSQSILHQRDQAILEGLLVERKVPRANARGIARDPELLPKRAEYDEAGSLIVHQAGQRIPFSPGNGQTHLSLLADELVNSPDVQEILISDGDAGGGVTGGRSQGPATGDKAFFDNVRKQAEAEQKGQASRVPLKERIKNR
jgi:hypothetical protein